MNQIPIWSHIQNENRELFLGIETRINRLLRIAGSLRTGKSILNIGAGNGYLELEAKRRGWNVVSVDPDERTCARLAFSGIDSRVGLAENLPVKSHSIDVVFATELLEHLSPDSFQAALAEVDRVLAGGGLLVGTVPLGENLVANLAVCPQCNLAFHRYGHEQSFTAASIRSELAKYFNVEVCKPVFFPPWNILNWKGKILASIRLLLSHLSVHGSEEKILFLCRKPNRG